MMYNTVGVDVFWSFTCAWIVLTTEYDQNDSTMRKVSLFILKCDPDTVLDYFYLIRLYAKKKPICDCVNVKLIRGKKTTFFYEGKKKLLSIERLSIIFEFRMHVSIPVFYPSKHTHFALNAAFIAKAYLHRAS